jgi:hypothetical protein
MGNWAEHPQTQAPKAQTKYSRFVPAGSCALSFLLACLLSIPVLAASDDNGGSATAAEPESEAATAEPLSEEPTTPDEGDAPAMPESREPEARRAAATTPAPELNRNVPLRYVVKKGDTLWDIADYFLKEPWKWPELWYGNPNIRNPHLIYPGDVLYLTYVDGRPRLSKEPPSGVEKLSPRVREESLEEAIPTIPGDVIRAFLQGPRVVGADELEAAPYIVDFTEEHLIGGAGMIAYAKGVEGNDTPSHNILRKGEVYRDPESNEILGYEAAYIGSSSLRTPGDPARINVNSTVREVLVGDRLLPVDESDLLASAYYPHAPEQPIEGYIIAATGAVMQIGQYQIVTLSKGARDGIEVGHVFKIHQAGRKVADPYGSANKTVTLPEEEAGLLLVFKTYERVSYGLVMKSFRSIHLLDKFRTPES